MRSILIILLALISSNVAFANTGVFFGAGNQVIPIKNEDIQLVKENVKIKLSIEENNGRFDIPFIPWANITATFHLKNTTGKDVALQIGFPFLDLQGFGDEKYVLENLDFKVLSNGETIEAKLKEGLIEEEIDPKGLFKKVFAWKDTFGPSQEKEVTVTYKLLMGVAAANSAWRNFDSDGQKYSEIDKILPAVNYSFMYITGTAYTWKGEVEKAVFQFDANEFLSTLNDPNFSGKFGIKDIGLTRPLFIENISPKDFMKNEGTYTWEFTGKVPEEGLSINFISLFTPSKATELKAFIDHSKAKLKLTKKEEFISILAHYYETLVSGKKPTNDFESNYFNDVWFVQDGNKLVFDSDRKEIGEMIGVLNTYQ